MKQLLFPIVFLACFTVLAGSAGAVSLEYYGIDDTIRSDLSVHNTIVLKFKSPVSRLDYQLGFRIYNLTTESSFPFANCISEDVQEGSLISCDFVGMTTEKNKLILDFDTNDAIIKKDGTYRFGVNYGVSLPIERVFAVIKLPENGILSEAVANQSYYPQDGSTASDGRHIMIYWEREDLTSGRDLQFSVTYTMPGSRDPTFNYIIIFLTVIVIIVMISIAFYMKKGAKAAKPEDVIESVLNRNEKAIVAVLNNHDGNAGQKVIVRESGFSKAKASRLVKNLQERGIVDIEPMSGRENKVTLKKPKKTAGTTDEK